jgi:hypothetical protein
MATRASIHQRSSRKRHYSSLKTHRLARSCLYQIAKRVEFDLQACEENIPSGVECEEIYPKTYDQHWARAEEFVHAQRLAIAASSENQKHSQHISL